MATCTMAATTQPTIATTTTIIIPRSAVSIRRGTTPAKVPVVGKARPTSGATKIMGRQEEPRDS